MTRVKVAAVAILLNNARWIQICLFALILVASAFADASDNLTTTLTGIYCLLYGIIPLMAFVLFTLAGAAYGIGNFFGAEVRAKANSWAMSCITGAIIALIIVLFSDILINNLIGSSYTITCPP
jgi:predicted Co/Zn/Cd cation transporter (cation efflux family)